MGHISKKLHRILAKNSKNLPTKEPERRPGEPLPGGFMDMQSLLDKGYDPVHAAYIYIQQMSSHFAESVSQLPELKAYYDAVAAAEEEYMPVGPPISPLTASYFLTWASYDLRIGDSGDTLGDCQVIVNDVVWLNPDQLDALKNLNASRMGIYEHIGFDGAHVCLRELVTGDEFVCHNASGYRGKPGELWYLRLLPPLLPELGSYHIVFTTPYILTQSTKNDWTQFLKRSMLRINADNERNSLYQLMKYGFDLNYGNEFVFRAYHHSIAEAIFLAGIPDLQETLPLHSRETAQVRIEPSEKIGLDLSADERSLILQKRVCPDAELEEAVRATADDDPVMLTLDGLEDLHGHCAAEANHTSDKKLKKTLDGVLRKIEFLLDRFTDDEDLPAARAATPAPDLAQGVTFTQMIAQQTKIDLGAIHAEIDFSTDERNILLALSENETVQRKLRTAVPSEAMWFSCEELCQILMALSSPLKKTQGNADDVLSSLAARLVQQATELLSTAIRTSRPSMNRARGSRINPNSNKIAVRLTQAQRLVVAELEPDLAAQLRLDEKNERKVEFATEAAKALKKAAGEAIPDAPTGVKRNSLRHIEDKLSDALDRLAAIGRAYQFKITLKDCEPPIWRRIQVKDCTLDQLHEHIQLAMGWTNSHLHDFTISGRTYGDPMLMEEDFEDLDYYDSTEIKISDILPKRGQRLLFDYQYDFGDSWEHEILFEGWMDAKPNLSYPLCIEGERACPPEDVGGTGGYEEFLVAICDPAHPEHKDYLSWCGGKFEADLFKPAEATKRMKKGLPNWREMEDDFI